MKAQKVLSYLLIVVYIFLIIYFIVEHRKIKNPTKIYYGYYNDYEEGSCNSLSECVSLCPKKNGNLTNEEVKNAVNHFLFDDRRVDYYGEEESSEENFTIFWNEPQCHFFESKVIIENETISLHWVSLQ